MTRPSAKPALDPRPGGRFGALHVWPDGEGWRGLPAEPTAQRDAGGKARFTVIEAGEVLILTLGTTLGVDEAQWTAARAMIAAQLGQPAASIDLRPADARPRGAVLMLKAQGADPEAELARATPSPLPPHPAAFSVMLRDEPARRVRAALDSGPDRLEVRYEMDLALRRAVTARLAGTPRGHREIEAALSAGDVVLTLEADPDASAALKDQAREAVLADAAQWLANTLTPSRGDDSACAHGRSASTPPSASDVGPDWRLDARVTCTEAAPITLSLVANVADWL